MLKFLGHVRHQNCLPKFVLRFQLSDLVFVLLVVFFFFYTDLCVRGIAKLNYLLVPCIIQIITKVLDQSTMMEYLRVEQHITV